MFRFNSLEPTRINAGEHWEFPEGSYDFSVASTVDVDLVKVWRLPDGFWEPQR